jgi:DNA-directed RNA polymerase II subunit RPB2
MNQSSIDRGFFRSLFFRSYRYYILLISFFVLSGFSVSRKLFKWFRILCRDEEKKMGTLVKEDFGRPNRENTMVS